MRTKKLETAAVAPPVDKSLYVEIGRRPGETDDQAVFGMLVRGTVGNASTVVEYSRARHTDMSLTDIARALKTQGDAVTGGDLADLERMLNGQAVALNAMFTELARRGAQNRGEHLEASDSFIGECG